MIKKEKVLAYVYRVINKKKEVLVFDHPQNPEVNPQVPAGSLELNESPINGVLREVEEESGVKFSSVKNYLGQFEYKFLEKNEIHERHLFEIESNGLPDKWTHNVKSNDEDNGEVFDFYWLSLEEAKSKLVANQGQYLPTANGHFVETKEILSETFNEELKVGGVNSNFSKYFGLNRIASHYFKIPSGYRTSEPHAESLEEEFVFVISGEIDIWLNGRIKKMSKGDCIGLPSGTGVGHTFINNYKSDCEIFVSGERTKDKNKYHFHLDQNLKEICGDKWWDNIPPQQLGGHDGLAGVFNSDLIDPSIKTYNAFENFNESSFSYPGDSETFINCVDMSRRFGLTRTAISLERIPVGKRSSWTHAHSVEEEFAFVLEGRPTIWLDGDERIVEPMCAIDFKAGSGVAHTLINNTDEYIYYICVGECEAVGDQIYYPEHPKRNEEMKKKNAYWDISSSKS